MSSHPIRVDTETYRNILEKQEKMNKVYEKITGKKKNIPLTRVTKILSKQKLRLFDQELIKEFQK